MWNYAPMFHLAVLRSEQHPSTPSQVFSHASMHRSEVSWAKVPNIFARKQKHLKSDQKQLQGHHQLKHASRPAVKHTHFWATQVVHSTLSIPTANPGDKNNNLRQFSFCQKSIFNLFSAINRTQIRALYHQPKHRNVSRWNQPTAASSQNKDKRGPLEEIYLEEGPMETFATRSQIKQDEDLQQQ